LAGRFARTVPAFAISKLVATVDFHAFSSSWSLRLRTSGEETSAVPKASGEPKQPKLMIASALLGGGLVVAILAALGWWAMRSTKSSLVANLDNSQVVDPSPASEAISNRIEGYPWESSDEPSLPMQASAPSPAGTVPSTTGLPASALPTSVNASSSRPATLPIAERVVVLKQTFANETGKTYTGLIVGKFENIIIVATTGRIAQRPMTLEADSNGREDAGRSIGVQWVDGGEFPNQTRQPIAITSQISPLFESFASVEPIVLLAFIHRDLRNDLEATVAAEISPGTPLSGDVEVIGYDAAEVADAYSNVNMSAARLSGATGLVTPRVVSVTVNASVPKPVDTVSAMATLATALPDGYGGGIVVDSQHRLVGIVGGTTSDPDDRQIITLDSILNRVALRMVTPVVLPVRQFLNGGQYIIAASSGMPNRRIYNCKIVVESPAAEGPNELARISSRSQDVGEFAFASIVHLAGQSPKIHVEWTDSEQVPHISESFHMAQRFVQWLPDQSEDKKKKFATNVDPKTTSSVALPTRFNGFAIDPSTGDVFAFRIDESTVHRFARGSVEATEQYAMPARVHAIDWNPRNERMLEVELLSGVMRRIDVKSSAVQPSEMCDFALSCPTDPLLRAYLRETIRPIEDPLGEFRIKGKEVQSWDGRRVASLSNDPVGLLEGAPLLVTVKQFYVGDNTPRALQLVSTNDWQPVGEAIDIQVPVLYGQEQYQLVSIAPPAEPVEVPPGPQGKNRAICSPLAIGVDQSRSEVVYCNEYTVDRYTLDQFGVDVIADLRLFLTDADGLTRANVLLKSGLVSRAEATTLPVMRSDGRSLYILVGGRLMVAKPASILSDWSGFSPFA